MRMIAGLATWVILINGVEVVVTPVSTMVLVGVLVPHQSLVAVTAVWSLVRLVPVGAVFPAIRLKLMVTFPAPLALPIARPPPLPVVVLPVMVTLVSETGSVQAPGQPLWLVLIQSPPPDWPLV